MKYFFCFAFVIVFASCSSTKKATSKDDRKIDVTFVQINDVYEIVPLSGGKEGGMARVATLKKKYQQKNPNTFLVMAGDFVSLRCTTVCNMKAKPFAVSKWLKP